MVKERIWRWNCDWRLPKCHSIPAYHYKTCRSSPACFPCTETWNQPDHIHAKKETMKFCPEPAGCCSTSLNLQGSRSVIMWFGCVWEAASQKLETRPQQRKHLSSSDFRVRSHCPLLCSDGTTMNSMKLPYFMHSTVHCNTARLRWKLIHSLNASNKY